MWVRSRIPEEERHGSLRELPELDVGPRIVVSELA
jgi:hypothetical protein